MVYALRSTIDKWDLIKLQSFCKSKDTVTRTKRQPTDREKIFINPAFDRRLISNIYKELKKLDSRESNNSIEKWNTELNKEFSTKEAPKEMLIFGHWWLQLLCFLDILETNISII